MPFPFLVDSFNPDDIYSTGYPVASPPPEFLLQAARALGGSTDYLSQAGNSREAAPTQPLMIELQNGRYVRVNGTAVDSEALPLNLAPNNVEPAKATGRQSGRAPVTVASPAHDLPAAVLVFRDGHSEEVRDYTIADGILYARGDFYIDGYWNKKIEIATLNLAQTLEANANRSVRFVLPSSPNEVITRP